MDALMSAHVQSVDAAQGRRVPVQNELYRGQWICTPPGTIAWSEHEEAWKAYCIKYRGCQTAEVIAHRGGFGIQELRDLLGHEPKTWMPRKEDGKTYPIFEGKVDRWR